MSPSSVITLLASLVSKSLIKFGSEMAFPSGAVHQVVPLVFLLSQSIKTSGGHRRGHKVGQLNLTPGFLLCVQLFHDLTF